MNLDDILLCMFEWVLVITTLQLVILCVYMLLKS